MANAHIKKRADFIRRNLKPLPKEAKAALLLYLLKEEEWNPEFVELVEAVWSDEPHGLGRYTVMVTDLREEPFGQVKHLWCEKQKNKAQWDWYELMTIKDVICGTETTAIEVYPRRSELVDRADVRHLYAFCNYRLPFGLHYKDNKNR